MQAAWYVRNGAARDVLQVGEQPTPSPQAGEVRIRIVCSGVNPSDVKSRAGGRPVLGGRVIPHSDGAGIIDSVGAGVDPRRVGERVWTWNAQYQRPDGTAAEYVVLPQAQAVPLPAAVSFEAGACLGVPALTAYRAVELAELEPGQTVLVIAGASAVGFYAAQLARERGARVITTVGAQDKAEFLHRAGFQENVHYKSESVLERVLAMTHGAGVDAIIDMDFSSTASLVDQGILAQRGRVVCYGSNQRGQVSLNFAAWMPRSLSLLFFLVYELTDAQRERAVNGLQALMHDGRLQHQIGPGFALADIAAAHEAVEAGTTRGNVIVRC